AGGGQQPVEGGAGNFGARRQAANYQGRRVGHQLVQRVLVLNVVPGHGLHYLVGYLAGVVHVGLHHAREVGAAALHVGGGHAARGQKSQQLSPQLIIAHPADERHGLAELVQVHGHVEGRAARLLAGGQHVPKGFAKANDGFSHKAPGAGGREKCCGAAAKSRQPGPLMYPCRPQAPGAVLG
nr:hypothetical protein [Tanacetum cinerariifolium]